MQMSDFVVNKYKSFVVDSREKKFSVGTFEQRRSGNHKHTYVYIKTEMKCEHWTKR